jgi:hypothetical protein
MKSAHVPQHEILPPPIDIAVLAKRNGLSELLSMRSIRSAEKRELAFSRIDSTLRLRWYWTVRQAIPDAGGESRCRLIRGKADLAATARPSPKMTRTSSQASGARHSICGAGIRSLEGSLMPRYFFDIKDGHRLVDWDTPAVDSTPGAIVEARRP